MSETSTNCVCVTQSYVPESYPRRVLLFNPPVYDTRFPWSQWQQPVTLLQLATLLHQYQCNLYFIDALDSQGKIPRRRMNVLTRGEHAVNYWRFGTPLGDLASQLGTLKKDGWEPEETYIEGFTTIWWEGVAESITLIREYFPQTKIILYGAYVTLATEHAIDYSGANVLVTGAIEGLTGLPLNLSVYIKQPSFTYLSIGTPERSCSSLVEEFLAKAKPKKVKESIRRFAFADYDVVQRFPEQFRAILKTVIDDNLKVSFFALGNIQPSNLIEDPELVLLLRRAGFKQLVFADDRNLSDTHEAHAEHLSNYHQAIELCQAAGYQKHTEELVSSICVGRLGENVEERVAFMTELAHVAGTLIVMPYQPQPAECPDLPLKMQNGKLFPFAERNGASYRLYQDLLGLAAVLNAKYRSHTFDFLGDSMISQLVSSSLIRGSWKPREQFDKQKEGAVTAGWLNKEGKWVRS